MMSVTIKMMQKIMRNNNEVAAENNAFFHKHGLKVINVMASPGAGKTSVILGLIEILREKMNVAVIEGDTASSIDAEKVSAVGIPVVQIDSGGRCHLDAQIIREAAEDLAAHDGILFIENIGNLICPSTFNLGEDLKMVIASVPEGHDKPYKYLAMFEAADIIVLNKIDLKPYIDFDEASFRAGIAAINTKKAPLFTVSCTTKSGLAELAAFLLA
ncbi:MAG: hydrogenase nickel incorporation protein HypB [bacterium]